MAERDSPYYVDFAFTEEKISEVIDEEVIEFEVLSVGWNNKAVRVVLENGARYIFRVTSTRFAKEKIDNEVAAITFLQQKQLPLPFPKIIKFGYATESFNFHWILMEFMEGIKIQDNWSQFTVAEKERFVVQAALIFKTLQSVELDCIGGWKIDHTTGSIVRCEYFEDKSLCPSEKTWIVERFVARIGEIKQENLCPDLSLLEELEHFGNRLPSIVDQFDPVPIVLYHGDVCFRNMLAAKDSDGNYHISAVLDWEWAGSRPIYADYQWSLLDPDTPSEELTWLKEHLIACGIDPSHQIPQYSQRMDLYFFVEKTLEAHRWKDPDQVLQCICRCREILNKFQSDSYR